MKKTITVLLALCMLLSIFTGCSTKPQTPSEASQPNSTAQPTTNNPVDNMTDVEAPTAPKYVFLFIGDGMSYPQFQAAADYLGAIVDDDYERALPFRNHRQR